MNGDHTSPEAITVSERRARKHHLCCECGFTIDPGTGYQHVSGIWDSEPRNFKTRLLCAEMRQVFERLLNEYAPFGHLVSRIGEECHRRDDRRVGEWNWLAGCASDATSAAAVGRAAGLLYARELVEDDVRQVQLRARKQGRLITLLQARAELEAAEK